MTNSPYPVGYGRPPQHTRFQKGQSGNPGGRPGPKKQLKYQFDSALGDALTGKRQALRDARPATVIDALARKIAMDALDGRPSAQKLVLEILDGEDPGGADESGAEETSSAPDKENAEEDRYVFEDEEAREMLGDRYGEFKERCERAVNANDPDGLVALVADFDDVQFPATGNF